MSDTTQTQTHTFVERALLLIEQQQMAAPEPLCAVDASSSHAREMLCKARSPWPARITAFAGVFALGIGVGNWVGSGTRPDFHFASAMAQDAGSHSQLNALQLRIDTDFEQFQPSRR